MLLHEFDPAETAIFNPEMVFSPVEGMPKVAVSCFSYVTFERMLALFPDAVQIAEMKCASQRFPVYKVRYRDVELALYMSGVGAPLCVGNQEEIYALGVECLVLFGTCGVLDRNIGDCAVILPTSAMRDEGTSYHYAPPSDEIDVNLHHADLFLSLMREMRLPCVTGKCWTTDSMYRETREKTARRKAAGCVCVDMECASVAAAARFRGKEALHFFYAADNLDAAEWDERSLSNFANLEEKDRIALIALEAARRITLTKASPKEA
ncbi:MAG: nucleoside phosphorylase [Clostridia bacterium]|nr:nucleoside phosphorylase [Clostridia bacterium]